ncbi:hypothetical protein CPB86DRAFT_802391 [Serendipita vermifera]|nr:hypothetical protein CPB86DRAFT_802391 [Serendipita vermifera]
MDISRDILELWKALDPVAISEWEELTRDIQTAYAQLTSLFGNGVAFDRSAWEDQRYYHARRLFLKWTGHQSTHTAAPILGPAAEYATTSVLVGILTQDKGGRQGKYALARRGLYTPPSQGKLLQWVRETAATAPLKGEKGKGKKEEPLGNEDEKPGSQEDRKRQERWRRG